MERTLADILAHAPVLLRTPEGRIMYWSIGCVELYGFTADEAVGRNSHELLQTIFPEPLASIDAKLASQAEWCGRLQHTTKDGRVLWTESVWRLRHAASMAARVVVEQNTNVTDRVEVEQHRELLTRELDHRVKNTLAVVQGIARLTFGRAEKELVSLFEERLTSLSSAHNILVRENWTHAGLTEIIHDVLGALQVEDRASVDGEDVSLTPNAAVAYALAFHELATNALKHGSLSTPDGRVEIVWRIEGPGSANIHLIWREVGGPPVKAPEREGFGTRLIRRALSTELNTPVRMHFAEHGFVCEFDGPVQKAPLGVISSAGIFDKLV